MNGNFISIFSGCGGSSLGYKWAGFKELLAIDFDKNSVETFKLNFPDTPVWQRDIMGVSGKEIMDFCKIKKGELDILDGSPPCQGFSIAGSKMVNDKRNNLFNELIRIIKEINPKVFIIENVAGQVKGNMRGKFKEIVKSLKKLNYNIKIKLMNSRYYNVPQSRERIIYLGIRRDLKKEPIFPRPSMDFVSVRDALKGVENKTFYTGKIRQKQLEDRLIWDFLAPTIVSVAGSIRSGCVIHPEEDRHLTIEEAKRICSFPDDFILTGSFSDQWSRLGNAVMPKFMEAIASSIKLTLYGKI